MANLLKTLFGTKDDEPALDGGDAVTREVEARGTGTSTAEPIHVTDDTFEELVLNSSLPTLVDFWAPWCGPCRMVAPIVEDLAKTYDGRAVVAKINTDENIQVATDLGIMGIPTLILFKGGQEVDRVVGFAPRHALEDRLKAVLN